MPVETKPNTQAAEYLPLVEAVERATGRHLHLSTVLRWASRGRRGIRLESRVIGGRRYTTIQWVLAYVDAMTALDDAPPAVETPKQAEMRARVAADRLKKRLGK